MAYGDCGSVDDAGYGRAQQPVINISWAGARTYVAWLSKVTGKPYRLLSEAEYEYATRAGTQTLYPWGDELGKNNANCKDCGSPWDGGQTAPVGSFRRQCLRPLRHGGQRVRVGRGLLARQFRRRAGRWIGLGHRRLQQAGDPRRFLVLPVGPSSNRFSAIGSNSTAGVPARDSGLPGRLCRRPRLLNRFREKAGCPAYIGA